MCVCNHVLVNLMKMSTYCVEFNSCCCFLAVLLTLSMHKCMCVSFVLSLILLICPPTAAYSTHNQRNLNATYRSLTVLSLCYCSSSLAHLLLLLPRALRCCAAPTSVCGFYFVHCLCSTRYDSSRLSARLLVGSHTAR